MLSNLKAQPADKILQIQAEFRQDPRSEKIDLGVGVYKNAEGVTPDDIIGRLAEFIPTITIEQDLDSIVNTTFADVLAASEQNDLGRRTAAALLRQVGHRSA